MGCDIHMRVEVRTAGGWQPTGPVFDSSWRDEGKTAEPWEGRNYNLFAMLANVRNGSGFAGIPTGEGFKPICDPRGTPEDAHPDTAEFMDSYGIDGHSHSWHTLAELRAYDWDGQVSVLYGVVPAATYEDCAAKGVAPDSYSGATSGPGIVTFTPLGYEQWKAEGSPAIEPEVQASGAVRSLTGYAPDTSGIIERPYHKGETRPYVRMRWEETYRDAAGESWFRALDTLEELVPAGGTLDDVRVVFFFDN